MASPSLFASRRKPKRVGREPGPESEEGDNEDNGPVVRKPITNTPRTKSKLRQSFNPAEASNEDSTPHNAGSISKKRPTAIDHTHSLLRQSDVPSHSIDRPSYGKDYLSELRNSTPSTPKDISAYTSSTEEEISLDIVSKFGPQKPSSTSNIPTTAEIEEKKQRRARLAKEHGNEDFIALEDYDSDGEFRPQRMQVAKYLDKSSERNTRLVRDDEDIAEGFEEFVDDPGKVIFSKKGRREQERREVEAMRSMIAEAEDSSEESDSSAERNHAYETAQTSRGMDGLTLKNKQRRRPQQPKEITPIPKLSEVLARFRDGIQALEYERVRLEKRRADLQRERVEISAREENIQKLLVETGDKFEKLKREAEISTNDNTMDTRGLENLDESPGP